MKQPLMAWAALALNGWVIWMIVSGIRSVKLGKMRSELQMKVIERLNSTEQIAAFLGSQTGQELFRTGENQAALQIVSSLRWASVLIVAGVSTLALRGQAVEFNAALGFALLAAGGGFLVAAAVSYFMGKRLGLLKAEPNR